MSSVLTLTINVLVDGGGELISEGCLLEIQPPDGGLVRYGGLLECLRLL